MAKTKPTWAGSERLRALLTPTDSLTLDPENARDHGERSIDGITASLRKFGQRKPIVVHSTGKVIAGNGTLAAARRLGWTHIATADADGLTADEARAFALVDNRTAELSTWNNERLAIELPALALSLPDLDLGWTATEIQQVNVKGHTRNVGGPKTPPPRIVNRTGKVTLHLGDCLDVLRTLADNSVDSIVTDPPYGLSFMGKKWDYDVPSVDVWIECLRVLKPGGHLLAFAGTRTQHRMAVRIEDAGFEIRDMIAWVYGSGFPKSLDVSKAIDKMDAADEQRARRLRFTAWVRSTGVNAAQIDEATGTRMGGHYTSALSQPAIMTREHLDACRHLMGTVPEWVNLEADIRSVESKNMAARAVIGHREQGFAPGTNEVFGEFSGDTRITAPATAEARRWEGWGTALKPALEPITVARKPLIGTVADNVTTWGTGGINVDDCRVGTEEVFTSEHKTLGDGIKFGKSKPFAASDVRVGRFPANLIHDGSDEVVRLFPETGASSSAPRNNGAREGNSKGADLPHTTHGHDDNGGSAARFFYCAKASAADRGEGTDASDETVDNKHPTVKPTELMRYLCRLVTPPGGVVLDPFMGSGSTGKAANIEGFSFVGIERDPESLATARLRIGEDDDATLAPSS